MSSAGEAGRHQEERQKILRAAYRLIGQHPESVSVHDILDAAGLSTRAFYRHFASKDELILTMYRTAAERVNDELRQVIADATDPVAGLRAWIGHSLAVVFVPRRARQTSVLTSAEARAAAGFDDVHSESAEARRVLLAELLAEGMRSGRFTTATDPGEDARAVMGAVAMVIEARLGGAPTPDHSEATDHLTRLFLRAFGAS